MGVGQASNVNGVRLAGRAQGAPEPERVASRISGEGMDDDYGVLTGGEVVAAL